MMMVNSAATTLRAVPLARSAASPRSATPVAAGRASVAASTSSSNVRLGGASFLAAGAVGLSLCGRGREADHAPARTSAANRRVVSASAASAAAPGTSEDDKGKTLRVAGSITGWFFLNAVFGGSLVRISLVAHHPQDKTRQVNTRFPWGCVEK